MNSVYQSIVCIVLFAVLILTGCSSSSTDSGDGNGNGGGTTTFSLTTNVVPAGGGSVTPSSGVFDQGDAITVQAFPADGFSFTEWTGDRQSTENPLTFTINEDTELTANFQEVDASVYTMTFNVRDSLFVQELQFGQKTEATSGFDEGIDRESPPPPAGGLHNFFKNPDTPLLWDFRNDSTENIIWNLQLVLNEGDSLFFDWSLNESFLNGSITLRNSDSSIQVDMVSQNSFEVDTASVDSLLIEYQLESN